MNWLPRFGLYRCYTTDPMDDDVPDFEGQALVMSWLGWVFEFTIARRRA